MRLRALVVVLAVLAAPAAASTVELANGDELTVEILERNDRILVVRHPDLGRIEIPVERLRAEAPKHPGLFGTRWLAGWSRSVSFGASGARGNSQNANITASLELSHEDALARWNLEAAYTLATQKGQASQHEGRLALRRDWLFEGSRWFVYAIGRGDYDDYDGWQYRLAASAGTGYELVKTERWTLRALLGPAFTQEFDRTQSFVEALVGLESTWKLGKRHRISLANALLPAFNHPGELRTESRLGWRWRLSDVPHLFLQANLESEYESGPGGGAKHWDFGYTTALGVDF